MTSNLVDSAGRECRRLREFKAFLHMWTPEVPGGEIRSSMTRSNNETYPVTKKEVRAEVLAIIWSHLTVKRCPPDFQLMLLRAAVEDIGREPISTKACDIASTFGGQNDEQEVLYDLIKLQKFAVNSLEKLLTRPADNNEEANSLSRFMFECKPCMENTCSCCTKDPEVTATKAPTHLAAAVKNKPRKMEDRHCCWPLYGDVFQCNSANCLYGFYGVFDGHGGPLAAAFAAAQLPQLCAERLQQSRPSTTTQHIDALKEAFIQTDQQFARKRISSGTTAVCALLCRSTDRYNDTCESGASKQQLYVAWVGDSKAMLVSRSRRQQLVKPHKPDCPDERLRIESHESGAVMFIQGQWRVNGILNVSRSIGDFSVSSVIAEPDVVCVNLETDDDFLVLGTDGLWDHAGEDDIVSTVYDGLAQKDTSLDELPKRLINLAKQGDSQDNITVVIVLLREAAKINDCRCRMSEKP